MNYLAIATDYDGTLAHEGQVDTATIASLEQYCEAGGHLVLVTGRVLDDLLSGCPCIDLFSRVIAENGSVLYRPTDASLQVLGEPFPETFVSELKSRGVGPIHTGHAIVATWEPHSDTVQQTLDDLGLAARIILNKRAVMVLPEGIDKATGLAVALEELSLPPDQTIGIGDAENDQDLLRTCGLGVAVANALPGLKAVADHVTTGERGAGVQELIEGVLSGSLA